jgi:hypothetical protein
MVVTDVRLPEAISFVAVAADAPVKVSVEPSVGLGLKPVDQVPVPPDHVGVAAPPV